MTAANAPRSKSTGSLVNARGAYTTTMRRPDPVRHALPIHWSVSKPGSASEATVRQEYPELASARRTWNPVGSPAVARATSREDRQPLPRIRARLSAGTAEGASPGPISAGRGLVAGAVAAEAVVVLAAGVCSVASATP